VLPLLLAWLHAVNDLFSNFLTPLLPKLMAHFGVGLGTAGLLVSVYSLTGSLLQPVAGLIADRLDRRLLAALGPLLVALGMGSLGLWPRFEVLVLVLGLAGLGSALFHASGASLVGEFAPRERKGFWLSFFGSAGYLGLSLGPIVALFAVGAWGLKGLFWLTPLALLPALLLLRLPPVRRQGRPAGLGDFGRVFRGDVARLWGMATLRSLVFMSFATTLPYWYAERGIPDAYTAISLSVYSFRPRWTEPSPIASGSDGLAEWQRCASNESRGEPDLPKSITKLIERFYGKEELGELAKELSKGYQQEEEAAIGELDESAAQKFVKQVIREAYLQDASDIHVEPRPTDVLVRLRVDGTLRQYTTLPKGALGPVISVIKIMGGLNIAEKRLPQDGRVRYREGTIDLDLRLSTLPTVYGEKAVMRLLKKAADIPEIEGLGFAPGVFERFQEVISKPYGIFLITGPTGSGKSFTTFSILKRIATPDKNTQTIEDPVEYEIPGINQTQVNPQAGLTFARALRAFLRQDPDIIMVGEIRDSETAKIATEAALTGHLVIATLHTNDAAQAITRLDEMGVELFNISAALIGVLSQRLVRRICDHCKVEVKPDPEVLRRIGLSEKEIQGAKLYKGMGCERCGGTGYKGRYAIHELLVVDDEIRHAIVAGKSATEIKEMARQKGMKTLREDGIYKALLGITTLEEVLARTIE
jgi:type II secretory ATPase GspE/PulE/Tfp pilus assembly ATPase PilB-like protein